MLPRGLLGRRKCPISSKIRATEDMPANQLQAHLKIVTRDAQVQEGEKCSAVRCPTHIREDLCTTRKQMVEKHSHTIASILLLSCLGLLGAVGNVFSLIGHAMLAHPHHEAHDGKDVSPTAHTATRGTVFHTPCAIPPQQSYTFIVKSHTTCPNKFSFSAPRVAST